MLVRSFTFSGDYRTGVATIDDVAELARQLPDVTGAEEDDR